MKPVLIIIAVITSLGVAGLFAHDYYQRQLAVENTSELVMSVTTDMLVNWNPDIVRQHASDSRLAGDTEPPEATQRAYTRLSRRLGALQEIYDIRYNVDMPGWWQSGRTARATFTMRARFETETATIQVELTRPQDQWQIIGFNIQPPAIAS
ncbi:MAG: hypothetical protein CMQ34_12810 [Gammaproteobacteria bacterium]|nr:hypothetical protein [Gammaproteobacteria bacterium]|tara:strand:+ start:51 stop:506 length:456 start_codon:yes stop_codon:yes gene_type:complete